MENKVQFDQKIYYISSTLVVAHAIVLQFTLLTVVHLTVPQLRT